MLDKHDLSPGDPVRRDIARERIYKFWNDLAPDGDTGETTWEVLCPICDRTTECLLRKPPDISGAEAATAEAMLLICGM
ncbi:MAG: hypothetical protein IH984_13545 [Planctomycetes bacterium]|nr:hypothetical protein [Planctomycetota bacterium]